MLNIKSEPNIRQCPSCNREDFNKISNNALPFESILDGKSFIHPPYFINYCNNCGLYFKSQIPDTSQLAEYYKILDFKTYETNELFPTDHLLIALISKLKTGSKVLDFGCGIGRILSQFTDHHSCYGVELNEASASKAREKNIQIISESFLKENFENYFDAIIITDVFEHLNKSTELLDLLTQNLKIGGSLFISTGNADSIKEKLLLGEFWYFRILGHLQMIGDKHIQWLSDRLNLELVESIPTCHYHFSKREKIRQYFYFGVYKRFKLFPNSPLTKLIRWIPKLRKADNWKNAPAITCLKDHNIVVYRKKSRVISF